MFTAITNTIVKPMLVGAATTVGTFALLAVMDEVQYRVMDMQAQRSPEGIRKRFDDAMKEIRNS